MIELLQMWALVEVLGFICLPLTITVFHNLPDRGWAFSKAIGMALLAFGAWFPLMTFHILPFSPLFIAGVLLIILACNMIGFLRVRTTILKLIRVNFSYIVASEGVFLGMVFLLGWLRSYGPDIRGFEMFMDGGFLAAIMRSPHFPPNDMWFSGYPINYYYYAHFTIAVLAKLLGQSPSIAFNTGICIFFGLTAVSLFGVTCNIVSWARHLRTKAKNADEGAVEQPDTVYPPLLRAAPYGLLTMIMGLVLGNLASTQQWWQNHGDYNGDLAQFNWFDPSRVVDKTINEFPAFSFLLSCFHAHVLALAFTIVAIALAFNLFLAGGDDDGGGRGATGLLIFGRGWRLPLTMGTTALILGGLFAMNGWDFPTYMGFTLICIALQHWLAYKFQFRIELVLEVITAGLGLLALSFIMYAPFYLNFISPSQGLGIVGPADRSQLRDELLIYGLFALVFISLLLASVLKRPLFAANTSQPAGGLRWLNRGTVGVAFVIGVGLIAIFVMQNSLTFVVTGGIAVFGAMLVFYHLRERSRAFTLLLGAVAFGLIAATEIFFLKDVFADNFPRMNTVFKFYFQAWALLSIASGAGLYFILESFRPAVSAPTVWMQRGLGAVWSAALLVLLLAGAVYPLVAPYARYARFDYSTQRHYLQRTNSLDGLDYLQTCGPPDCDYNTAGDFAAIRWLNQNVSGDPVIVEAIGDDYSFYARVSALTGLPSPMGWVGHEYQWRVNWLNNDLNAAEFYRRGGDIDMIYTDPHPEMVMALLARYQAQYLYVGPLEHQKYPKADLGRFSTFLQIVYSADGVTIYKVN